MKALFIGGTGIISAAVSKLAIERGVDLYQFNRGNRTELFTDGAKIIKGDVNDYEKRKSLLQDYEFDVVVDWLAFKPSDIERDIALFENRVKQFIFISSASVYQKPLQNYLITETTPTENPFWQYARDKIACEARLVKEEKERGFPVTIVRPSFTYGVTLIPAIVSNNKKPMTLINRMRSGKKIIVPGDGSSLWVMTHNSDFAKGLIGLMGNEKAIGETFHITSDEVQTWDQIIKTIGRVVKVEPKIIHIPTDFINAYAPKIGEGLLGDKSISVVFDNSKIKKIVPDFECTVKYEEGITRSLKWIEEHPSHCEVDEENNIIMDYIIDRYESALQK